MTGRWSIALFCCVVILQQDQVTSQLLIRSTDGMYYQCEIAGTSPANCEVLTADESALFSAATEPFLDMSMQMCGASLNSYHLFSTSSGSELFRNPLPLSAASTPVQNLAPMTADAVSFDICCDNVFYSAAHYIVAQNLNEDAAVPKVSKRVYGDAAERTIQHVEVCCYNDRYGIFFSIDDDGLYSIGMDGGNLVQIVDYGGALSITSLDYNCVTGNEHIAIGSGMEVRLLDTKGLDPNSLPLMYSSITVWDTNTQNLVHVSLGSVPGAFSPITVATWAPGSEAATVTTAANTPTDVTASLPSGKSFDAVFMCNDPSDCALPCPETCPCSLTDDFQDCCIGLCLPRNTIDGRDYSCSCNNPDTLVSDACTLSGTLPPLPTTCPLDLIGAIKCQGGNREGSSSVYALSLYSLTSICPTAYSGKETPMPRGAIPLSAGGVHSLAYRFNAPTQWHDFKGDRYGLYTVRTGSAVDGMVSELVDSIPVVFQENSKDLYADYITKTVVLGSNDDLRVNVRRPCDARRVRWIKNGIALHQYKGKLTIPLKPFSTKDEGIYEAYFQGRIKRDWRVIIRLIAADSGCDSSCTDNDGVCSYGGSCICPPGKAGVACETVCTKGSFGIIGQCGFTCQQEFGDECADCQNILFCLEDPAGCHCYPGYELPNCTPCRTGYWGLNCENRCSGGACNPYDGTLL